MSELKLSRRALGGILAALMIAVLSAVPALAGHPAPSQGSDAVATSASASASPVANGLVGYWPFEMGDAAIDHSGSGNTVTFANGIGLISDAAPTQASNGWALVSSNAVDSYATAPGHNINNLQSFSIALWVKVSELPSIPMSIVSLPGKASLSVGLGGLTFTMNGSPTYVMSSPALQAGVYYHVTATYGAAGMTLYINADATPFHVHPGALAGSGVTFSSAAHPLRGELDDVRIYDRELNAAEAGLLWFHCSAVSEIPSAECGFLYDLFDTTSGPAWTNHTGWASSNTPCSWADVLCDSGHVIALALSNNGVDGALPSSIGNLSHAVVLQLDRNEIGGPMPSSLGNLSELQTLDLYRNRLTGSIPSSLGNLSALSTLRLQANALAGPIPSTLANDTSLTTLDLDYNMLTASGANLVAFLNSEDPNWATTQTVHPTAVHASSRLATSVTLAWTAIPYTADTGRYQVLAAKQPSNAFVAVATTADKSTAGVTVTHLAPGSTYRFVVRTVTSAHDQQQNRLVSTITAPIAVATTNYHPSVIVGGGQCLAGPLRVDLSLTVTDPGVVPTNVTVTAHSSNPGLVAQGSLVVSGGGSERTLTIAPTAGHNGFAGITVTARDGHATSTTSVNMQVGTGVADTLNGTDQADVLMGSGGNDTLRGAAGNDTLCGGPGDDTLGGGPGADSFGGGPGSDQASDFSPAQGDTEDGTIS